VPDSQQSSGNSNGEQHALVLAHAALQLALTCLHSPK
jgi:hypothetical protein